MYHITFETKDSPTSDSYYKTITLKDFKSVKEAYCKLFFDSLVGDIYIFDSKFRLMRFSND